ncbi:hypothetical protein JAAARDRAFT_399571 [Jaapia argillacea MUCL 33604]|uniref:Transmembrane protein n=1 Tax=Jaapia argillacea MUCL 33604 TaxID=933084 RepID=A0A067PL96_9AGAM|nr:hypothetical protein JAAARDRAFT_399571 [Jaapia argillacea MUCL 33604]
MDPLIVFVIGVFLSIWSPIFRLQHGVSGQSTTAQCNRSSPLTQNSLGESPCVVLTSLWQVCTGNATVWGPLPQGDEYDPPKPDLGEVNACTCSSVIYVLVSACGWCQNRNYTTWAIWTTNCTSAQVTKGFPASIPSGIAVPHWAYMDVSGFGGSFDPTIALQIGDSPESSAGAPVTPSTSTTASSQPTIPISSTIPTSVPTPTTTKQNSDTGAIVGGSVGGFVVLAVAAILLMWFLGWGKDETAERELENKDYPPQSPEPPASPTLAESKYSYYATNQPRTSPPVSATLAGPAFAGSPKYPHGVLPDPSNNYARMSASGGYAGMPEV